MTAWGWLDWLTRWRRPKRVILGKSVGPIVDDVRVHVLLSSCWADAGEFHHTITAVTDELFGGALVEFPAASSEFFAERRGGRCHPSRSWHRPIVAGRRVGCSPAKEVVEERRRSASA